MFDFAMIPNNDLQRVRFVDSSVPILVDVENSGTQGKRSFHLRLAGKTLVGKTPAVVTNEVAKSLPIANARSFSSRTLSSMFVMWFFFATCPDSSNDSADALSNRSTAMYSWALFP